VIKTKLIMTLSAAAPVLLASAAPVQRPNVIFILSDDHRADLMEFAGHPLIKTPHLNSMAAKGIYFPNAFANSPLCTPSRASFFSGKYCERTGAPRIVECASGFLELEKTFPEYLHAAGYKTGFIGKWHLGEGKKPKKGFDYWVSWNWVGGDFDFTVFANGVPVKINGFTDDWTSRKAADFVRENAGNNQPFFLYLGLKAPHLPFAFPERLSGAFDGIEIPKPASYGEDYEVTGKRGLIGTGIGVETFVGAIPKFGSWDNYSKSYYRAALSIDGSVGNVLAAVRAAGIEENTIIIYSSDHGYHIGEHALTEKHYTYRHSLRIPMVMQYPALIRGGIKSDALVMGMDIAPTVLELCGVSVPADMNGKSWLPVVQNNGAGGVHEYIYSALNTAVTEELFRTNLCVENDRYKLIWFPTLDHYELFDTKNDVDEMNNLARNAAYAGIFAEMKQALEQKIKEAEWGQSVSSALPAGVYVLGPVMTADDASVRKSIFSSSAINYDDPINVNGRTYNWKYINKSNVVNLTGHFENRKGARGYIAFPVENLQHSTGFLRLAMNDNKIPSAGLWNGRVIYVNRIGAQPFNYEHSGLPWFFEYSPPLRPGRNDVVLGFIAQGEDVPLVFPLAALRFEGKLAFPVK